MDKKTIGYWITTGLLVLPMGAGGLADLVQAESMLESMELLGYPSYLLSILGVAELLGLVAVLLPKTPRLKEWAYAGFTIDLLGAAASHGFVGDYAGIGAPVVVLGLVLASWWLRPDDRKLQA